MELSTIAAVFVVLVFVAITIHVGLQVRAGLYQWRNREQPKDPQSTEWEQVTIPDPEAEEPAPDTCPACDGTGFCARCAGHGRYPARGSDRLIECANCGSSGACQVCAGTGRLSGAPNG